MPRARRADGLLRAYADRLPAVELNNTFYQQPKPDKIAAWLAATPADFRFVVKAQRGGSMRAFGEAAAQTVEWLTAPYRLFGERLGSVLYRVPANVHRDEDKLRLLLAAWPADMPLTLEAQHASWQDDAIFDLLRAHGAAVCATDLDDERCARPAADRPIHLSPPATHDLLGGRHGRLGRADCGRSSTPAPIATSSFATTTTALRASGRGAARARLARRPGEVAEADQQQALRANQPKPSRKPPRASVGQCTPRATRA